MNMRDSMMTTSSRRPTAARSASGCGSSAARSACRCRRSRPRRTRSSRPRCSAPTSAASGPSRCPASSGWPSSTTCRSTSCCPAKMSPPPDEAEPPSQQEAGGRPAEAHPAQRPAVRDAHPLPEDDPGAAPGLQRQGHHRARRRHPGHRGDARRAGRPGRPAPRRARPAVPPLSRHPPTACAAIAFALADRALRRLRPHPVLRAAVRLLRVRHLDRSPPPAAAVPRRAARRHRRVPDAAAGDQRVRRRRHADAGRPRRSWPRCCAAIPTVAGAEVTVECNPDDVTVRCTAHLSRRRREPGEHRRAVDGALTCSRRSAAPTSPTTWSRAVAAVREAGIPTFNLDLIYGGAGESLDDWRATLEGADRARAAPRLRLRAHGRGRHAAGAAARPPPRRRRPGRQVRAGRRAAHRCRPGQLRDQQLGPARARVPPQHPLLAAGRLPRVRQRRAQPPRRAAGGGTCAPPSATSPRWRRARRTEAAGETLDDETRRVEGLQLALADARRGAGGGARTSTGSTGWWRPTGVRVRLTRAGRLLANEVSLRLR